MAEVKRGNAYYSPGEAEKDNIQLEILAALVTDPTKDPLVTIEGSVVQEGHAHLDYALELIAMVKKGDIRFSASGGWEKKHQAPTDLIADYLKQEVISHINENVVTTEEAEELLMQIVANPDDWPQEIPAEQILDNQMTINKGVTTQALTNLMADEIFNLKDDGTYLLEYLPTPEK